MLTWDGPHPSPPRDDCPVVTARAGGADDGDWQHALVEAASRGGPVVVDLGQVQVLDSAALGLLLSVHRRLRQHGSGLLLRNAGVGLERVLRISGLDQLFRR